MRGSTIAVTLLLLFGGSVTILLWPNERDIERAYDSSTPEKEIATVALRECGELLADIEERKPASKKKQELGELRQRYEQLSAEAERLRAAEDMEREDRRRALDDVADRFFQMRRDAEDLRARLREMQSFLDDLGPVIAELGRLQHALIQRQQEVGDPAFLQRSTELIQKSKVARDMAEQGLQQLSVSITRGRPLCQSALHDLQEIIRFMRELVST